MDTITERDIRILLVNEQTIVRAGLRLLLESQPGFSVVGEADDLLSALETPHPATDIILLDLKPFSHQVNQASVPAFFQSMGTVRILLLTDEDNPESHLNAVRLGARGLVHKNEPVEVLLKAIARIVAGEVWINRAMMARVIDSLGNPLGLQRVPADPEAVKIATLTDREREVVGLIGEGLRNRQIAERLLISEITVRHHLTSIFDKLGVADRFELAIYSYRHGLAKLPV